MGTFRVLKDRAVLLSAEASCDRRGKESRSRCLAETLKGCIVKAAKDTQCRLYVTLRSDLVLQNNNSGNSAEYLPMFLLVFKNHSCPSRIPGLASSSRPGSEDTHPILLTNEARCSSVALWKKNDNI